MAASTDTARTIYGGKSCQPDRGRRAWKLDRQDRLPTAVAVSVDTRYAVDQPRPPRFTTERRPINPHGGFLGILPRESPSSERGRSSSSSRPTQGAETACRCVYDNLPPSKRQDGLSPTATACVGDGRIARLPHLQSPQRVASCSASTYYVHISSHPSQCRGDRHRLPLP